MPAGDGTGPTGMGPRTDRGMGYRTGHNAPGWANPGQGRRYYGRGAVRSWRHWYYATGLPRWARWGAAPGGAYGASYGAPYGPASQEQEIEILKDEAEGLKEQLDGIRPRMGELSQG